MESPMPLTKEEVLERMKNPAVVLLNVLSGKDFDKLHIKDSQCLTLGPNIRGFAIEAKRKYGKQTFFITYGADKQSTLGLNAAKILTRNGFQADNYPGGLLDWTQAGLPTDITQPPPPTVPAPKKNRKGK
jgi:rhodanese-related sulfurtransferase